MPRFLNTHTGAFEWHDDPSKIRYAILSHKWQSPERGGEQSYQRVCELQADAKMRQIDVLAHPDLSDKVKRFCEVAREDGFRLGWLDSCCIDKSSSTELSEAINSMYELYGRSNICYAYLADVPEEDSDEADRKWHFARDLLHTRGWTLQELIAPTRLTFLARTWKPVGTKSDWAGTLEKITKIPVEVLTGQMPVDSTSVAQRMSWAANRQTTRVEDRAYSLLGIFGIHMSPMYGEGTNAFLRLQEKIIKKIPDQSVFAWGVSCELRVLSKSSCKLDMVPDVDGGVPGDAYTHGYGLLASSPRFFDNNIVTRPPQSLVDFKKDLGDTVTSLPSLHCSFTPEGARIQLLCIPLAERHSLVFKSPPSTQKVQSAHALALLQCMDSRGRLVALPLCAPFTGKRNLRGLTLGTITPIEDHASTALISGQCRLVRIAPKTVKQILHWQEVPLVPQEVTLLRHFSVPTVWKRLGSLGDWYTCGIMSLFSGPVRPSIFAIAPGCTAALEALGFTTSALDCRYSEREFRLRVVIEAPISHHHGKATIPVTIILALPERTLPTDVPLSLAHIEVRFITAHEFSMTDLDHVRQQTSMHYVDASMPPSPVAAAGFVICNPCDTTCENEQNTMMTARRMTLAIELSRPASDLNGAKQILVSIVFSEPFDYCPPSPPPHTPAPPPLVSPQEALELPTVRVDDEGEGGDSGNDKIPLSTQESPELVPNANEVASAPPDGVTSADTPDIPSKTVEHVETLPNQIIQRLPGVTPGILKRERDAFTEEFNKIDRAMALPGQSNGAAPLSTWALAWNTLDKRVGDLLKLSCQRAREAHSTLSIYRAGIYPDEYVVQREFWEDIRSEVANVLPQIEQHISEVYGLYHSVAALMDDLREFEVKLQNELGTHIDTTSQEIRTARDRITDLHSKLAQTSNRTRSSYPFTLQSLAVIFRVPLLVNNYQMVKKLKLDIGRTTIFNDSLVMKRDILEDCRARARDHHATQELFTGLDIILDFWRSIRADLRKLHEILQLAAGPNARFTMLFGRKLRFGQEYYDNLMKSLEQYLRTIGDNLSSESDETNSETTVALPMIVPPLP